jgi:hypothetical protein
LLVRRAVRLDLVLLAGDELRRLLQIGDREIELADRDVAVAAMAVQARLVRMLRDAARVDVDGVAEASEVGEAAPQPDRGIRAFRIAIVVGPRPREIGLEPRLRLAGRRRRDQWLAEQRRRFRGLRRCGRRLQHAGQRRRTEKECQRHALR